MEGVRGEEKKGWEGKGGRGERGGEGVFYPVLLRNYTFSGILKLRNRI